MEIRKILVPHDGGQMSDKALMYAAGLAKALDAELVLLYVAEEVQVPPAFILGKDKAAVDQARGIMGRELEKWWSSFAQAKTELFSPEKIRVSAELRSGDPAGQILQVASEKGVDLIVVGSRRLEGASKVIMALGSVARKVSERAHCPVMIVR